MQKSDPSSDSSRIEFGNGLEIAISSFVITPDGEKTTVRTSDVFTETGDNCIYLERTWNLEEGDYRLETTFEADFLSVDREVFVPAVMYRGNEKGKGSYPRTGLSKAWSFSESRSSIPACVQLYDGKHSFIVAALASEAQCSVSWDGSCVSESLPAFEAPYSYRGKNLLQTAGKPSFFHGTSIKKCFVVFACPSCGMLADYCSFVSEFSNVRSRFKSSEPKTVRHAWRNMEALLLTHLLSLVEKSDEGEKEYYLVMGRGNGDKQAVYDYTAASFLVKSLEGALVLAASKPEDVKSSADPDISRILEAEERKLAGRLGLGEVAGLYGTVAAGILKFFFRAEHAPGVFQDCYDFRNRLWGGYLGIGENSQYNRLVNARCNGEAMMAYLRLSDYFPEYKDSIIALAERVAEFYLRNQLPDGNFGRWWSPDGKCVNSLGTNGAYILSFLVELNRRKPEKRYESAIWRAGDYYARMSLNGDFFGDTLDADSCDKESGEAILSAMMDLWDGGFRRPDYFKAALNSAMFVTTWVFQDTLFFESDSPMGAIGFDSLGMTSASVANQHLDFYGFLIAYDFLRLHRASGDDFFRKQADLILEACRQCICSPGQTLGSSNYGWQPEQFNHTDWDYFNIPDRRGTYTIDIAWVTVLSLGALKRLKEEFPRCVSR